MLLSIVASYTISFDKKCDATGSLTNVTAKNRMKPLCDVIENSTNTVENELKIEESIVREYESKMDELSTVTDKEKWFLEYKELIEKYDDFVDSPETIYNYYSEDELDLLYRVVEAEVGDYGFDEKCNVISVIFNRVSDERFGNSLKDVLIPSQFSTISNGRYKKKVPTEQTKLACEFCFMICDTTNGALFFEASNSSKHITYAEYLFCDDSGHKFYTK